MNTDHTLIIKTGNFSETQKKIIASLAVSPDHFIKKIAEAIQEASVYGGEVKFNDFSENPLFKKHSGEALKMWTLVRNNIVQANP